MSMLCTAVAAQHQNYTVEIGSTNVPSDLFTLSVDSYVYAGHVGYQYLVDIRYRRRRGHSCRQDAESGFLPVDRLSLSVDKASVKGGLAGRQADSVRSFYSRWDIEILSAPTDIGCPLGIHHRAVGPAASFCCPQSTTKVRSWLGFSPKQGGFGERAEG